MMNRAAARLNELYPNIGDQKRLAEETGVEQSYLSRILRAERTPGTKTRRLFWEHRERIPMHWWDEPAPDGVAAPEPPEDDEPTRPELPVLLEERRQSSYPPPPLAFTEPEFQAKSRAWFDRELITETDLPPVRLSERARSDTDRDPRAGDMLEPTPKPLTVLDRVSTPTPDGDA